VKKIILEGRLEMDYWRTPPRGWLDRTDLLIALRAALDIAGAPVENEFWEQYSLGRVRITIEPLEEAEHVGDD